MHTLSPDYFHSEDYYRYPSEFLRTSEAADYLHVSAKFLEMARSRGNGPAFVKIGRSVRYMRFDLDAYMRANKRSQTIDAGRQATPAQSPCGIAHASHKYES